MMDRAPVWLFPGILLAAVSLAGCSGEPENREFVARVGESYLTVDEVVLALSSVPPGLDSLHAAQGIVNRWVTDELLAREARRRDLLSDPEVQRRIAENERSILISTLIDRLYDEVEPASESAMEAYFERNVDNLELREQFWRIRYLSTTDSADAVAAITFADSIRTLESADSLWMAAVGRLAENPEIAAALSSNYYPSSRLFRNVPDLQEAVAALATGQATVIIAADGTYHILQLVDRVEAGTLPRMEWISEELQNRLLIERRKQMYADQVQRLRNRALAEGVLEIRNDPTNRE